MQRKRTFAICTAAGVVALIICITTYNRYIRRHAQVQVARNSMQSHAELIAIEFDQHKRHIQDTKAQMVNEPDAAQRKAFISAREKQYCQAAPIQIVRYEQYREELRRLGEPIPAELPKVVEASKLVTRLRAEFELPHYRDEPRFLESSIGVSNGELITNPDQIFGGPDK